MSNTKHAEVAIRHKSFEQQATAENQVTKWSEDVLNGLLEAANNDAQNPNIDRNFLPINDEIVIEGQMKSVSLGENFTIQGEQYEYVGHPQFMLVNEDYIYIATNRLFRDGRLESGLYRLGNDEVTLMSLNSVAIIDSLLNPDGDFGIGYQKFLLSLITYGESLSSVIRSLISTYFEYVGKEFLLGSDEFTEVFRINSDSQDQRKLSHRRDSLSHQTGKRFNSGFQGFGPIVEYDYNYLGFAIEEREGQLIVGIKKF
jgi:hypothetical protein